MNKGCLIFLIVIIVLVVVGAGGAIYYLYGKNEQGPVTYNTEQPTHTDIVKKTVATGSVKPRKEILIKPQISGVINDILVEAGDKVETGALIAKVQVVPDMVGLNNAENRVSRAEIALDNANMDYERNKQLLDQGVIAPAEFQQFEIARRNAVEELKAAEDNYQILKEGVAKSSNRATNTQIRSTINGMVLDVPVEEGNSVIELNNFNEGTTIASVADMDDLIFEGNVDESEVEKLSQGMDLILTIGAIEDATFDAKLEYISPKGVEENGAIQFQIRAAVQQPDDRFIRAGYSANADVVLDRRDSVLAISESLVQFDKEDQPYVEVSTGENEYERRDVKLGLSDGITVEVLEGVEEGDEIKIWNRPIRK
ncbi:efflux RND transporter periplasmic adaptor subunit [Halocola ammonii]